MAGKRLLVDLYYDVVSPYTYFGFEVACRYRKAWNMDLKLKPFFASALMKATGNNTPAVVPNKAVYCFQDFQRLSKYHKLPFGVPDDFVEWLLTRNTLQAQRFLCALLIYHPQYVEEMSRQFFRRLFVHKKEIMSVECIPEVAKAAALPDEVTSRCLQALKEADVKDLLKKHTDEALELKAFGTPTFIVHNNGRRDLYFGQDRFDLIGYDTGRPWLGPFPDESKA